jgi:hypothetical protein
MHLAERPPDWLPPLPPEEGVEARPYTGARRVRTWRRSVSVMPPQIP